MDNIASYWPVIAGSFTESAKWFLICAAIFIPLAYLFPLNKGQPHFRRDMTADSLYWFLGPLFYRPVGIFFAVLLLPLIYSASRVHEVSWRINTEGLPPLNALPVLLQAFLILLITDFFQYWMHRFFHHHPLWQFHAVHHSPVNVDWLSSARFHPINIIFYSTLVSVGVWTLGFSPEAMFILFPFNSIYSPLVHANLNWSYGPFKYVLASPVFHRWHHTHPREGGNKNFAPTFPFLDLMFGTFYMPKGRIPEKFGTEYDIVPDDFLGQLAYPFHRKTKK